MPDVAIYAGSGATQNAALFIHCKVVACGAIHCAQAEANRACTRGRYGRLIAKDQYIECGKSGSKAEHELSRLLSAAPGKPGIRCTMHRYETERDR